MHATNQGKQKLKLTQENKQSSVENITEQLKTLRIVPITRGPKVPSKVRAKMHQVQHQNG